MCLAQGHNTAPKVIEPLPSRLLLSQYAIFEVLLIFMTMRLRKFHIGSLDERAGQIVSMVILIVFLTFLKFSFIFIIMQIRYRKVSNKRPCSNNVHPLSCTLK